MLDISSCPAAGSRRPRGSARLVPVLLVALIGAGSAWAQPVERRVLGLYNSAEKKTEMYNPIRSDVAMVLNYLGLQVEYHDVAKGLPGAGEMQQYRGVVAWLETDRLAQTGAYWDWLGAQLAAGRRVVLLNAPGPRLDQATSRPLPLSRVNGALAALGVAIGTAYSTQPLDIEMTLRDSARVEFERRLAGEVQRFTELRSIDPRNQVLLSLRMRSTGARSDAVVLTPNGGVVCEGYARYIDPQSRRRQWRIDPFYFFSQALGVEGVPRFDCTTLCGARVFYSHIDADGMTSLSLVDRQSSCGSIICDRILSRYQALPFTASVIVAEVDPRYRGSDKTVAVARKIFALPNVEAASHSFSHPLVWNSDLEPVSLDSKYMAQMATATRSGKALLPWPLEGYAFDPVRETAGSCRYVSEQLLPPGRQCRVMLWSGNCLPDTPALAACADAGLLNLNGGDGRFDGDYPSYSNLAPLYRPVGPYHQVYTSAANENPYTNSWQSNYAGYQNVLQTYRNSETPRRVLPVNVYFHYYSGEREASLGALQRVMQWVEARSDSLYPVYASDYVRLVEGFISGRLVRRGARVWLVTDNGACQTLRFDSCALYPDLDQCTGVLGFRHYQGALYVFLDETREHTIALTESAPRKPYLTLATAPVNQLRLEGDRALTYHSQALVQARFVWANLPPGAGFTVLTEGKQVTEQQVQVDSRGVLAFTAQLGGPARVRLTRAGSP